MTETKQVAASIKNLLEYPIVKNILDRNVNIEQNINEALSWWSYDLFSRKPSPAYDEDGVFKGTDLDLACFLYALSGRGSVINIPQYRAHTRTKIREDQHVISTKNRHGKLLSVGANKEFFSFNITIDDQNVIGQDKVGDYRTFSLTDKYGNWYDGWSRIEFVPTMNENKFITENKLWSGHSIIFKNFIHPNRWTSFFGKYYIITKMLIERLEDESAFLNTEMKRILETGITFPSNSGPKSQSYQKVGKAVRQKFPAFEAMIYIPENEIKNDYSFYPETQEALMEIYSKRVRYTYKILPALRFMTRATEYAHFRSPNLMPGWLKNVNWENDFVIPGKRTKWQRLKLFQSEVGVHSVSILKREYEKTAEVAAI